MNHMKKLQNKYMREIRNLFPALRREEKKYLRKMEENIGCVRRGLTTRKAVQEILNAAEELKKISDPAVSPLAERIVSAAQALKE